MEPCKFEDKIIDMYADIKWLRRDAEKRNGVMETHLVDSELFRTQITRNTVWRHVYKVLGIMIFITLGYVLFGK